MGKILLNEMIFTARHGACPHEYEFDQKFKVDIIVETTAVEEAGATDELEKTINYAEIFAVIEEVMMGEHCQLIETLAYQIGQELVRNFQKIDEIRVKVTKMAPPIPRFNGTAAVEVKVARHE